MRIAIDVAQTCVEKAGCGYYADSLAGALARTPGVEELILLHHFGRWLNSDTKDGTQIDQPNVSAPFAGLDKREALTEWTRLASGEIGIPGNPDIVHCCSFQAPSLPGVPLVFTVYDVAFWTHPEYCDEANRLICQRGILDAVKNASGLLFISEHARTEFNLVLGGWLEATSTPHAVVHLAPRNFSPGVPVLKDLPSRYWLSVGSIEPRKNYDSILDAHERYWAESEDPLPLVIAGSKGWKSAHVHTRIAAMDPARVRYLGFVPDAELGALYTGATGLIFPSWYEGFGLPVCEAMQQGCPVICSNRASLPEVAGDAALLVEPHDFAGITRHMISLERDTTLLATLKGRGLKQAARFSWSETARLTASFYSEVIEHSRAASSG